MKIKEFEDQVGIDPFKILDHRCDDCEAFYTYIDDIHRMREHKHVGLI